ncbi:unannotated protein [freshwater metagenome]|uniref:Unannotated protein n=1 Tax=freshwater metagenome TaxID=449393 RepID=A0A6J7TBD0_9ZZZZ
MSGCCHDLLGTIFINDMVVAIAQSIGIVEGDLVLTKVAFALD